MSLSYSDRFSDLLCGEDSSILSGDLPECSSDLESPTDIEESIAGFIEDERNFVPGFDYLARFRSHSLDASAREESVAWILKVRFSESDHLFPHPFANVCRCLFPLYQGLLWSGCKLQNITINTIEQC